MTVPRSTVKSILTRKQGPTFPLWMPSCAPTGWLSRWFTDTLCGPSTFAPKLPGVTRAGTCAFNVYVKDGVVWREEQMGAYEASGDAPDYGPRGCQTGIRQAKYMYGKQRVLYPMKRVGKRGEGKWQRISWDQATSEIADKFIEHATTSTPESITFAMGTQMILKRASFSALFRFCNITGIICPETFAGVGDLPVGAYMTLGNELAADVGVAVEHLVLLPSGPTSRRGRRNLVVV